MKLRSLKARLALCFGLLLLFVCGGLFSMSAVISRNAVASVIDESLTQLAKQSAKVVAERINAQLEILEALAETDAIKGDELTLDEKLDLLKNEVKRNGHLRINIADTTGKAKNTDGDITDISSRDYFKKALSGENAVSDPIFSKVDNSLILAYAVPIKDGDTIKGVLVAIRDGNELSDIIMDFTFGKNGNAFMINSKGITVADQDTSLVYNMDNDFENVKENPELESLVKLEQKMVSREVGAGEYSYNGVVKYMGFAPVEGTDWSLGITAPKSEVMEKVGQLKSAILALGVVFTVFGIAIAFIIALGISKPITLAANHLNVVATGDFTEAIPARLLKMKDETGVLANAINTMQHSIKNIIKKVIEESSSVNEKLININAKMGQLNKNMEDVSATTQELSAGIEETSASAQEMNATSEEIESAIEAVTSRAHKGALTVREVAQMSEEMKQNAIDSQLKAREIYRKVKGDLQNAIEQSKAVNKINELSEAILEITSQTNLLALNAAIEASRAGEAGKGFTVVAQEIRKLAENSKKTVSGIQEMTKVILEAVNSLTSSSEEIMKFIEQKVVNDYNYFVSSSEKYSQSSAVINEMITDFSVTAKEILASMQSMVKTINEISTSSNEEAQGAANIAQSASDIAQMSNDVISAAESAKESSNALIKTVSSFKV